MSIRAIETGQPAGSNDSNPGHIPPPHQPEEKMRRDNARKIDTAQPGWAEERKVLEETVAELRAEQQRLLERYVGLEEQNSALTTLYVACQSLHNSLDKAQILLTAREIIANLIGCEEYVLFRVAPDGWLIREDSFGLDPEVYAKFPPAAGLIGQAIQTGNFCPIHGAEGAEATELEANLTACIPLKRDGTVTGVIALFRLLPQKFELQNLDHELFRLLETHLAHALHCSELQQAARAKNGVAA